MERSVNKDDTKCDSRCLEFGCVPCNFLLNNRSIYLITLATVVIE